MAEVMKIRIGSMLPPRLPLTLALIERLEATLPEGYTGEAQAWNHDFEADQVYVYPPKDPLREPLDGGMAGITIEEDTSAEKIAKWEDCVAKWIKGEVRWCSACGLKKNK